jgi:hypothetical protein
MLGYSLKTQTQIAPSGTEGMDNERTGTGPERHWDWDCDVEWGTRAKGETEENEFVEEVNLHDQVGSWFSSEFSLTEQDGTELKNGLNSRAPQLSCIDLNWIELDAPGWGGG